MNKKLKFPQPLLGAIQEGRLGLVQQLLESGLETPSGQASGPPRHVEEAEDRCWREALNLAIRLGHEAITDILLANVKFDFRQIHEALLVAVDTNQPAAVRRLLARLDREKGRKVDTRSFSLAFFDSSIDGSRFAPGVTPLTLACQKDLYEVAQLLMEHGHSIARPHPVSCACLECSNARRYDLLKFSLSRINTYRGIASRAHLSLASEDAMLAAFQLSRELRRLARKEPEFKVGVRAAPPPPHTHTPAHPFFHCAGLGDPGSGKPQENAEASISTVTGCPRIPQPPQGWGRWCQLLD